MVKKGLGSRSGHTPRQMEAAFLKRCMCERGYESGVKAAEQLGITSQAFGRAYKKWVAARPAGSLRTPVSKGKVPKEKVGTTSRAWIENMKVVSAAVKEGKAKGIPARTVIDEVSTIEGIDPSTIRRHIKLGLTGMSPCKRGRKTILPADVEAKVVQYAQRCSADLEPLAHGELRGAIQDLVKGTELEDKFKGGVVSKSMVQGFLARHSKEVWSEHPQNMSHLRALWST